MKAQGVEYIKWGNLINQCCLLKSFRKYCRNIPFSNVVEKNGMEYIIDKLKGISDW